jgi:flagellar hook-associated protein 3 FlgL
MRINPSITSDLSQTLASLRRNEEQDLQQLASGKKLNALADDPASAADLVLLRSQLNDANQFSQNVSSVRGAMQVADSTLNSVISGLSRASSLAIQGANGTLSAADRQSLAVEVTGIQQQILSLANTSYQGNYLFGGTAVTTQAFAADPVTSAVSYVGNTSSNSVQIGEGQYIPTGLPGSQIFTQAGSDIFAALGSLAIALQNNGNVSAAATQLQNAFDHVNQQRAFYGSSLARLDSADQFLSAEQLQLKTNQGDLAAADVTAVASDLNQVEVAKSAVLAATARASQLTLLDYLK